MKDKFVVALAGNPNSGKTTLFNALTGNRQYVGNWPGVTVEKKEGEILPDNYAKKQGLPKIFITDLPGIYSLSPYSLEETVTREYIVGEHPDLILNIVDATNIERNLYLTTQLMDMDVPTVVALNMIDELEPNGITIDIDGLSKKLDMPVLPISARSGKGVKELIDFVLEIVSGQRELKCTSVSVFEGRLREHVKNAADIALKYKNGNTVWYGVKLLENDGKIMTELQLSDGDRSTLENIRQKITESDFIPKSCVHNCSECKHHTEFKENKSSVSEIISAVRYAYISSIMFKVKKEKNVDMSFSDKLDRIMANRYLGIPIFFAIMFMIFQFTFGPAGSYLMELVQGFIDGPVTHGVEYLLDLCNAPDFIHSLLVDGVISGVGGVVSFVPQIMILFFFLSFLEDSGYMARVAFNMDILLKRIGLNGKSFIPMVLGFGCTVPAVMAAKALDNERERRLTIMLVPFVSCSARAPVYAVFISAFFAEKRGLISFGIYLLGFLVAILMGFLLRKTVFRSEGIPFVIELPQYRWPSFKGLMANVWEKGKGFLVKAGTVILAASVCVWLLQNLTPSFKLTNDSSQSIMAMIGRFIAPIFTPMGFGDWRAASSLLAGLSAKESVVSSLEILYASSSDGLAKTLTAFFTPASAMAFMTFVLLYTPCVAAIAAIRKELASWKRTLGTIAMQLICAYVFSFIVYRLMLLL